MARPRHHASQNIQPGPRPVSQCVSSSAEAGMQEAGAEEDEGPIFSLSKSSVDVLMATRPPHARDPAWTRLDLRRSSSANTHSEQDSLAVQQLHAHMWQRTNAADSHEHTHTHGHHHTLAQGHRPNTLGERWLANVERWRESSSSTYSRSSSPETILCPGGTSRPSPAASPFMSPVDSPSSPALHLFRPPPMTSHTCQREDFVMASSTASQPSVSSTSPASLSQTKDEGAFPFPISLLSSLTLEDGSVESKPGCLVNGTTETPPSITFSPGDTKSSGSDTGTPVDGHTFGYLSPTPSAEGTEEEREKIGQQEGQMSACCLELPLLQGQSCPTGSTPGWQSPLISSLSDSHLDDCCRCKSKHPSGHDISSVKVSAEAPKGAKALMGEVLKEEGTMTSHYELADAAVQTASPVGSWWNLRKNMSSNMSSHSILGSPPGSKLDLMVSLGSNMNLVSPSSSMFQVESDEEEEEEGGNPTWEVNSPPSGPLDRRRSCLKRQGDERRGQGELGRRSSMKQVQWDEEGMTWDVYGADLDPEDLRKAIRKHLEIQGSKDRETLPPPRNSKKKKEKVAKEKVTKLNPPVMVNSWTSMAESEEEEGEKAAEEEDGKKESAEEATLGNNDTLRDNVKAQKKEDSKGCEEEEECISQPTPLSAGSGRLQRKSVMRSLRRPRWCGGSMTVDD
ncbi:uncharacterized protein LOC143002225 [Genypterus blacodes]|uniref:uncharacterized protein LOC143002225 n=1 Tax=Genypterus blacodes TaxID=154954 RepID=UPI003F75CB7C